MPPERQEQIEELLLTDGESYEELLIVEDELVDDYLRDKLSADERRDFRQHFLLTPERQEKLRVARALKRYVDRSSGETTSEFAGESNPAPWWRGLAGYLRFPEMSVAVPAMLVLLSLALGTFWIVKKVRQQPAEIAREATNPPVQASPSPPPTPPTRNNQDAKETDRPPVEVNEPGAPNRNATPERRPERVPRDNTAPRPSTLAVALTPGILRSAGGMKDINLSPDVERLQLIIGLTTDDYTRYRAVLQTAGGRHILSQDLSKRSNARQGPSVTLPVPAKLLAPGEYRLSLSGATPGQTFEPAGQYYFKISKN